LKLIKFFHYIFTESSKQSSEFNKGILNTLHDIQSLEWVLPETRSLLERQFRNEMMRPKQSNFYLMKIYFKINHVLRNFVFKESNEENINKKPRSKSNTRVVKAKKTNLEPYVPHVYASKLKKWLDNNSLAELRLSIFDVLGDGDISDIPDDISETNVWKDVSFFFSCFFLNMQNFN